MQPSRPPLAERDNFLPAQRAGVEVSKYAENYGTADEVEETHTPPKQRLTAQSISLDSVERNANAVLQALSEGVRSFVMVGCSDDAQIEG